MAVTTGPVEHTPDGDAAPPTDAEIEACLRVLAHVRGADPDDPRWAAVRRAVDQTHRAGKRARKVARRAERRRHDHEVLASTARFAEQDPAPPPTAPPPDPVGTMGTVGALIAPRRCYVCKTSYRRVHSEYHLLCPECAEVNAAHRHARCDLRGRRAMVTGGRIKIGFQVALKLLRDGAEVLVTSRFPRDAARRFAAVPDHGDWLDRLHVYGVDLLDVPAVAELPAFVERRFGHLDILVNNAAQTIRRPRAYHREVLELEAEPPTGPAALVDVREGGPPALTGGDDGTALLPVPVAGAAAEALFPAGLTDETGQPLDLRDRNSWSLRLHEVDPAEWLEVHVINAFAPFLLTARLRDAMEASPFPDRYVVQVSAMEGSFSRKGKTVRHPHTNMAKASLNMLTRTAAADYARSGIHMNSVDTGWVTDERPHPAKAAQRAAGFRPPLDVVDGAARVYHPIVAGVGGERMSGLFLKDYRPVEW
ncbi:SDR family NAD(P)-dependent oxidoreductase [Thermomonospora umbrina]|uniref:Enoyl-ACP reductase-like protein n=1 Tax=Thermomonospora umbrina TaxID=111806 RepID=A0A3D9SFZ9_9ACTN|nr:SDR family oxidoreductase [Thermomonospora umbrina]REE94819.1 enoyl-ACP reductase-like protein [Thermomonospora umbrina]